MSAESRIVLVRLRSNYTALGWSSAQPLGGPVKQLRITGAELDLVDIPLKNPYVSSQSRGGKTSSRRTIIRLQTNVGLVGVGETTGTDEIFRLVEKYCRNLVGHDPFDVREIWRRFIPNVYGNYHGRNGWLALAGIDMACWDLAGKAREEPLWRLLGGKHRDEIPVAGLMSAYPLKVPETELASVMRNKENVPRIVDFARGIVDDFGFSALKIKSAGIDWAWDASVMRALRTSFGPDVELRLDPNGAFTVSESIRLGLQVQELDLEYLEDPTRGMDGMARLRRELPIPLATNMCIIDFEQLSLGIRTHAVDAVLGDVYHWGGVLGFIELAAVCRTFGIDMGIHSFIEAGVGTAVNLHLAAVLPTLNHAIDAMLHQQACSIITETPAIVDGKLKVPDGVGLGVQLDENAIRSLSLAKVGISE